MKLISLNASTWQTADDFFSALLPQLGAPNWHGYNLNALDDSLYGGMNEVEPPFRVVVTGTADLKPALKAFLRQVTEVFADARRQHGADVELELA